MAQTQASRPGDADGELHTCLNDLRLSLCPSTPFADRPKEICPVCKSSRYLNPKMRFLINPECYHRMCESCVDRIFSQGPAPCPIAGCGRTLRKARFRRQTFEDLKVERECDIRARIEKMCVLRSFLPILIHQKTVLTRRTSSFNRREDEFTSLRAYNDYLEFKEDITFNLIERVDVPATEAKLAVYSAENSASIGKNAVLAIQEHSSLEEREAAQREISRLSREAARKEEEDQKQARESGRREFTQLVAAGKAGPEEFLRQTQKVVLKKSTARRSAVEKTRLQQGPELKSKDPFGSAGGNGAADPSFTIQGLKAPVIVEEQKPYDPFDGMSMDTLYYSLQTYYEHPWLENARNDAVITAGGYDVQEYYARAMLEGNAGLCCYIADEKATPRRLGDERAVATAGAVDATTTKGDFDMSDDDT
ncbi:TFIIH/NER complex subunit [Xylographa vitiligo]|nr:TFIIH/NER complex subunit [Xylographa vitiligo]